jgi:hypothetical protein
MMHDYVRNHKNLVGFPLLFLVVVFCFLAAVNPPPDHLYDLGYTLCALFASIALGVVAGIE